MFLGGDFSPPGHQWVALAGCGLQTHELSKQGLNALHIMASFSRTEGALRPLLKVNMDGESVLFASLSVCTPRSILRADSEAVKLTQNEDPKGVITNFATRRNAVVTTDNLVRIREAKHDVR